MNSPKYNPNEEFNEVTNQIFNHVAEPDMKGFLQDYASLRKPCDWLGQQENICAVMETYTEEEKLTCEIALAIRSLYGCSGDKSQEEYWDQMYKNLEKDNVHSDQLIPNVLQIAYRLLCNDKWDKNFQEYSVK